LRTASEATAAAAELAEVVEAATTQWPVAEGSDSAAEAAGEGAGVGAPTVDVVILVVAEVFTDVVVALVVVPMVVVVPVADEVGDVSAVDAGAGGHDPDVVAAGPETVPATALVVCVPFAPPPAVLTNTSLSVSGLCQYFGAASMTT
jgi:hypothetical protein